jgi:hypothetical protein
MRKTAFGTFAEWLLMQIPLYVDSLVSKAVSELPKPKDGKSGKTGVSVVSANIAVDDHLVLKLSDGKEIDAGELPMKDGQGSVFVSGNSWQIIVSDTPPTNPPDKQLWFATNLTSACD